MVNIPTVGEVFAAFFSASAPAGDPGHCVDSRDWIEPEAEEPEAEP